MSERPPTDAQSVRSSQADVWFLKQITFGTGDSKRPLKIITQNFNGPCSFIAICNILILRGQIEILPADRMTVSYEFLAQLVGEYLLLNCPDIDISAALSVMPSTTKGLDLNPQFTSVTAFSPSDTGELDLFARAGISLVHGWVVDPDAPEAGVMAQLGDYDTAATLIADADYLTQGGILGGEGDGKGYEGGSGSGSGNTSGNKNEHKRDDGDPVARPSSPRVGVDVGAVATSSSATGPSHAHGFEGHYSDEDRRRIEQAIVARHFLDATRSQLTYHGLFQLASTLEPGSLVALFRNAHLSVVYKSPGVASEPRSVTPRPDADRIAGPSSAPDLDVDQAQTQAQAHTSNAHAHEPALYALVTDDVFLHEPSIVWERLEDIDGGWSTFVDSDFLPAVPVGGDVAGQTAEAALRRFEVEAGLVGIEDPNDQALARQLQAEEDERAREAFEARRVAAATKRAEETDRERERRTKVGKRRGKKIKDCVVM